MALLLIGVVTLGISLTTLLRAAAIHDLALRATKGRLGHWVLGLPGYVLSLRLVGAGGVTFAAFLLLVAISAPRLG